jgi:hypothetical protein
VVYLTDKKYIITSGKLPNDTGMVPAKAQPDWAVADLRALKIIPVLVITNYNQLVIMCSIIFSCHFKANFPILGQKRENY